jgi:exosortase E/protease (VPEID-CTERM system)
MATKAIALAALFGVELVALVVAYRAQALPTAIPLWLEVNAFLMKAAFFVLNIGAVMAVALVLVTWPHHRTILAKWGEAALAHPWRPWVFANLIAFILAFAGAFVLSMHLEQARSAPWGVFALWCSIAALLAPTLVIAFAPLRLWLSFAREYRVSVAAAAAAAALASLLMTMSESLWGGLSDATLSASVWVLQLYETDIFFDLTTDVIRVADFAVLIGAPCSGFQGMGLVTMFLSLFIWAFRREFRFPNVLLLIPLGIVAVWCLNVVRIVTLITIGAHVSPSIALTGFHDHAGWLAFLTVSITLMFVAYHTSYFRKVETGERRREHDAGIRLAWAYLLPFVAIITAGIVAQAFSEGGRPLYALSIVAALAAIWPFRDVYLGLVARPQLVSVVAGLLVGAGWIATDPGRGGEQTLGSWFESLPAWLAVLWIAARVVGSSIFVPIAEELAFRGYLHRALIGRRFEMVEPRQFTWLAFIVSTALFAAMHQRWLAAAIAGAVYALVMYRTNRVSDAVVAHMASNALIAAWAIAVGQWSLL